MADNTGGSNFAVPFLDIRVSGGEKGAATAIFMTGQVRAIDGGQTSVA